MLKKGILILLFLLIIISTIGFFEYKNTLNGFSSEDKVPVFIEYGTPVQEIIYELKNKDIIKTSWPIFLYLKINNSFNKLQAGDFIIQKGLPVNELIEVLSHAHPQEIPLRIIEGKTIEDIDNLLVQKTLISPGEFVDCTKNCKFPNHNFFYDGNIEGFLFPDTYYVDIKTFTVQGFISRLLNNFQNRFLTEENISYYKKKGLSLQKLVIMASIIEKEEFNSENRPIVAGILWKRLKELIPLGADATTRYYEKNKKGQLLKHHFEKDNPYNTRKKLGLPPTAICNPGLNALKAALYPEKSDYYYYLHDKNGQIHYATTNDEHNYNKRKYLW